MRFTRIFDPNRLADLAKETGFIERQRQLTADGFVDTITNWQSDTINYPNMSSVLSSSGIDLTPQALAEKAAGGEVFMKALVQSAIDKTSQFLEDVTQLEIPGVERILSADASTQALHPSLAGLFPGTGGSGPEASIKVHLLFDYTRQAVAHLKLTDGKTSDQSLNADYLQLLNPGDLIINDLGYFDTENLGAIEAKGASYLTRIPASVTYFWNPDESAFDLWSFLGIAREDAHHFDLYIGEDRELLTRVVAIRLPRPQWKKRAAELAKKKGRPLTATERTRAKWNLYATSLTAEQVSAKTVRILYATRWQVELVFKSWKSGMGLTQIKNATTKAAMATFIWARLLYGVTTLFVRSLLQRSSADEIGILRWQSRIGAHSAELRALFYARKWLALAKLYWRIATTVSKKEKRVRKTTLEKLCDSIILDIEMRSDVTP